MRECESWPSALSPCGYLVSHVDALVPLSVNELWRLSGLDALGQAVPNGCKSRCWAQSENCGGSHLQVGMAYDWYQESHTHDLPGENVLGAVGTHEKPVRTTLTVEGGESSGGLVPWLDRTTVAGSASGVRHEASQPVKRVFARDRHACLGRASWVEHQRTTGWRMNYCAAVHDVLRRDRNANQLYRNRVHRGGRASRLHEEWESLAFRRHTSRSS